MRRHEFLRGVHDRLQPSTYLEIGVQTGRSMALSRATSIGVDPAFTLKEEVSCRLTLVRSTSDEFFARPDPLGPFEGRPPDLAFIDGMHLYEYALRDYRNVERLSAPWTVVLLDDVLPRVTAEASRDRPKPAERTGAWAGDVFKTMLAIEESRPDLLRLRLDTQPTGLFMVLLPDAANRTLDERYPDLVRAWAGDDPQDVPADVLGRTHALQPEQVLASPVWSELVAARQAGESYAQVRERIEPVVTRLPGYRRRGGLVRRLLRR